MIKTEVVDHISFAKFICTFKKTLKSVFYERDNIESFIQKRGFPPLVLRDIMAQNPLSVAIPQAYGGRGTQAKECLGILDAASYESLPLSLIFGINIGLFLEPVAKYAQESVKKGIYHRFLTEQNMGGLMITEPDYGSDALNMQTSNVKKGTKYHIKGIKHWQGLTGVADYWIMTSRQMCANGKLSRDIDFFICDAQHPDQYIEVIEYYNNIGLYPISYGKNNIDIHVSEQFKLTPESTGLRLMMDMLHRSRLQFPGMGIGFIRRMLDEAMKQCTGRIVRGKCLIALDEVQRQIAHIQSAFTICSAMCSRSAVCSGTENNLADAMVEANTMKTYTTDLMQESAQTLTQLCGANGYKVESVGARGIVDSRPFQIFEGSNEMLYTQISEMILKLMGRRKIMNLLTFMKNYELTQDAAMYFKLVLNFKIQDGNMPQRKIADLGRIISRVISANYVIALGHKGFRPDLIKNSLEIIQHEVTTLVSSFKSRTSVSPIQEYQEDSCWLTFC